MKKLTTKSHPLFNMLGYYPIESGSNQKSQALKYYEQKLKKNIKNH